MRKAFGQKGIALPTVLAFVAVLLILGFALTIYGTFEQQNSRRQVDEAQAYYIARAGAASLAGFITSHDSSTAEQRQMLNDYVEGISSGDFGSPVAFGDEESASFRLKAELTDDPSGESGILSITSEGTFKNSTKLAIRQLRYNIGPNGGDPLGQIDHAVFVMNEDPGNINLGNGDIYYDGSNGSDVTEHALGANVYDPYLEEIKQNSNLSFAPESAISNPAIPPRNYTFPSETIPFLMENYTPDVTVASKTVANNFTENISITAGQVIKYVNLSVSGNLIFNTSGETYILVETLSIANTGKMMFTGGGPIYIIVNSAALNGQVGCSTSCYSVRNGKYTHIDGHGADCFVGRVNMMYDGATTLTVNGNDYDQVSYIAGNAIIEIKLTGGSSFSGHIFTNASVDFNINGTAEYHGLVFAPEADITGRGNADVYGMVVGDSIDFNGNRMSVIYNEVMKSSLPFLYPDYYALRGTEDDKGIHESPEEGGEGGGTIVMRDFSAIRWK